MQTEQLTKTLIEQTRQIIIQVEKLKKLDDPTLHWRQRAGSWNILECIEHLNRYGNFYLPEMEGAIKNSGKPAEPEFKSGLLGGYFAKSMLPRKRLNKMKTFKDKNPLNASLEKNVIDTFITQQLKLIELLDQSSKVSLNRVKIKTSISKFIRLNLGDAFQVLINHMLRHLLQIEKILAHAK